MRNNNNPSLNSFLGKRKEAAKSGFTLVELIVVITILAILGTIAFISMSGYSAISRDSVRLSDVSTMTTGLEVYHVNSGKYPLPDEKGAFTLSGETLWSQGFFGDSVVSNLSRSMSEAPLDPLSEKRYVYSIDGNKNAFQILNPLEGDDVSLNTIGETNAAGVSKRTPRVSGSFNGLFVRTASYILPIPSIITSTSFNVGDEIQVTGISDITSQVVSGGSNIPSNIGNTNTGTTGLSGLAYKPVDITSVETSNDKSLIMTAIKEAYENETSLSNDGIYNYVINVSGEDNLAAVYDTIVLGNYEEVVAIDTTIVDSDCISGTMSGSTYSSVVYNYDGILTGNTGTGTAIVSTSAIINNYEATVSCENGIISILNESNSLSCPSTYTLNGSICERTLISENNKQLGTDDAGWGGICYGTIYARCLSDEYISSVETSWAANGYTWNNYWYKLGITTYQGTGSHSCVWENNNGYVGSQASSSGINNTYTNSNTSIDGIALTGGVSSSNSYKPCSTWGYEATRAWRSGNISSTTLGSTYSLNYCNGSGGSAKGSGTSNAGYTGWNTAKINYVIKCALK